MLKKNHPLDYDRESDYIQPHYVLECLNKIVRRATRSSARVSASIRCGPPSILTTRIRGSFLTSGSMGTMGFGLPAAIGAQFARPDRLVINIDGDGSLRMNLGEMETVTNYNLPVKTILFNNQGDGMVRQWQKMYFCRTFLRHRKVPSSEGFRERCGRRMVLSLRTRISEKNRVERVLQEFVHFDGPAFLEVMIDPDACVFPMIGPGMGYKEMVTGPHIKPRANQEATKPPARSPTCSKTTRTRDAPRILYRIRVPSLLCCLVVTSLFKRFSS